jgi:Glycine/D-amino acid oxidases (deaminating)
MTATPPRIGVIGAGIMGLATAWALHRRGAVVSVFEQGPVPNPKGSSVDESRLIRHPYGNQYGYTAMVDPAFAAWDQLFGDLTAVAGDEPLYHETGSLVMDTGGAEQRDEVTTTSWQVHRGNWIESSRENLTRLGIAYEISTCRLRGHGAGLKRISCLMPST